MDWNLKGIFIWILGTMNNILRNIVIHFCDICSSISVFKHLKKMLKQGCFSCSSCWSIWRSITSTWPSSVTFVTPRLILATNPWSIWSPLTTMIGICCAKKTKWKISKSLLRPWMSMWNIISLATVSLTCLAWTWVDWLVKIRDQSQTTYRGRSSAHCAPNVSGRCRTWGVTCAHIQVGLQAQWELKVNASIHASIHGWARSWPGGEDVTYVTFPLIWWDCAHSTKDRKQAQILSCLCVTLLI